MITKGVRFLTHDGSMSVLQKIGLREKGLGRFGKIKVGNNVFIGWNSIIMPGITIGNNVIIGAGSIVTHDIPNNSVVAGIPARIIQSVEELSYKVKQDTNSRFNIYTRGLNEINFRKKVLNTINERIKNI